MLDEYMRNRDEASRAGRITRAAELLALGEPRGGRMLYGDCLTAFVDARESYINGNDLAAVLSVQACLEKLLSGFIDLHEAGPAPRSFAKLLSQARNHGILGEHEYGLFDRLRRSRNPHAHYRDDNHPEHPLQRSMASGTNPAFELHRDAQAAVRALVGMVNSPPFALGPSWHGSPRNNSCPRCMQTRWSSASEHHGASSPPSLAFDRPAHAHSDRRKNSCQRISFS